MKTHTHPTPEKFALATSAIVAADWGIGTEVKSQDDGSFIVEFPPLEMHPNGYKVRFIEGPLQEDYKL